MSMLREELSVSVVIAARNEKGNIEDLVKRIPKIGKHTEIVFIEGGSTDGTDEEIKSVAGKYPEKNIRYAVQDGKGKGDAIRKGFDMAGGDVLMILDADISVLPEELPLFFEPFTKEENIFVNGTRLIYPMEKGAMRFLNKYGNKTFAFLLSMILDQKLTDTLCGTKVLMKSDYEKLKENRKVFGDFDPFGDFDLLFGATYIGLKIVEVPVNYKARVYGKTNIERFKDGWQLFKMTWLGFKKFKMKK